MATSQQELRSATEGLKLKTSISEKLRQKVEAEAGESMPFLDWSMQVPEAKTGYLDFERFPFQPEIYRVMGDDRYRDVVVRKSTQVGMTALMSRWAIYQADRNGRTLLYVFPTLGDVHDFSDERITPMVDGSEYLLSRRAEPFNKGLKRFGVGFVYFRGSENKRGLDSVAADGLALDEYDTLNQANIPDAERRLSGPMSAGLIRRVGVPSLPEFGIAERYDQSDRRKWLVQCGSCDHLGEDVETKEALLTPRGKGWQEIDFWLNVDQSTETIVCAGCGEPLDVGRGQWVAQNPDAEVPGFHVTRLIVPNYRLRQTVESSRKTSPYEIEVFHNKDLGRPYVSKMARLSPEQIAAAQREFALAPGYAGGLPVTMGVDVASERALNVRISAHLDDHRKQALWIGEIEDDDSGTAFDQLSLLMGRYSVNMCGIDAMPESRLAREFQGRHWGRVYLIRKPWNQKQVLVVDDEMGEASVRGLEAMDALAEMVRRQNNLLPIALPDGYLAHMTANVRRVVRDDLGQVKVFWEATRPDDYAQAELYDLVATELYYRRLILEDAMDAEERPLDEMVAFNRSSVTDLTDLEWTPGPGGGDAMYEQ